MFFIVLLISIFFSNLSFANTCEDYKRADQEMYELIEKLIPDHCRTELHCDDTQLKKWCLSTTDKKNKFLCEFKTTTEFMASNTRWNVAQNRHLEQFGDLHSFFKKYRTFADYLCTTNNFLKPKKICDAAFCHELGRGNDETCLQLKKMSKLELLQKLSEYKKRIEFNKNYSQCVQSIDKDNPPVTPVQ